MIDQNTLFCGNLSEHVTDELLYELFLQAGPVTGINIPKTRCGKNRHFGFISFKHAISVPYAIKLMTGEMLFGRKLQISRFIENKSNPSHSSPNTPRHPGPRSRQIPESGRLRSDDYGRGDHETMPNSRNRQRTTASETYRSSRAPRRIARSALALVQRNLPQPLMQQRAPNRKHQH